MFLNKRTDILHTLAFRLSLWHTAIFVAMSLGIFLVFYIGIFLQMQTRTDEELLSEVEEFSTISDIRSQDGLQALICAEAESEGASRMFFRVMDTEGRIIFSSDMSAWGNTPVRRDILARLKNGAAHVFETLTVTGRPYQARVVYGRIAPDKMLQAGKYSQEDFRLLETLRRIFAMIIAPLIFFSAFVGWFLARRALKGVEMVTETALAISEGDIEQRVRVNSGSREIERLASAFNHMLDRINVLIASTRQVSDNIAHDLKTPVSRIRGMAERMLGPGTTDSRAAAFAADTIEECDGLLQMINTMLDISEVSAGAARLEKTQIDMAHVIRGAVELFQPLAEQKHLDIRTHLPDRRILAADLRGIQRTIINLLENAIKYTEPGGTITIVLHNKPDHIVITFQDTGIGISETDLPRIFDRLYRCDGSRNQPGFGLGLSLARAIVRAHGGDITVSSRLGDGSTFTVTLPDREPYKTT